VYYLGLFKNLSSNNKDFFASEAMSIELLQNLSD